MWSGILAVVPQPVILVCVLFAVVLGAATTVRASTDGRAALRLAKRDPIVFGGSAFKAGERVTITAETSARKVTKVVRASRAGTFTVTFATLRYKHCDLEARATGGGGSRAVFKVPEAMCPVSDGQPAALADARR